MRLPLILFFPLAIFCAENGIFDKFNNQNRNIVEEYDTSGTIVIKDTVNKDVDQKVQTAGTVSEGEPVDTGEKDKFQEFWKKLKEEEDKQIQNFKEKLEIVKKQRDQEKKANKKEFEQKEVAIDRIAAIQDKILRNTNNAKIATAMENLVKLTAEKKKKLADELLTVFEAYMNAAKIKKEEKRKRKEEIREQLQPSIQEFFNNLRPKIEAWKTAKKEEKDQRWEDFKVILLPIIQKAIAEKKINSEAEKQFWSSIRDTILQVTNDTVIKPEAKATFIDRISGTSSWQNITWILLAVCFFLALLLLIAICNQPTQRKRFLYQRLPGDDGGIPSLRPKHELQQEF